MLQETPQTPYLWPLLAIAVAGLAVNTKVNTRYTEELNGVTYNVFHHPTTKSKLRYVNDSGICETTPGVHQHSGSITVKNNMHMFFWLFEARHSPETAPLVIMLAGGPGGSMANDVFGHGGPRRFEKHAKEPTINPYSFNEFANLLFIDAPSATGFSYGQNPIDSTFEDTEYIWKVLQAFFAGFEQYRPESVAIFGGSYVGHTGPSLAAEIFAKNAAVQAGSQQGIHINLTALCLQNALIDYKIQLKGDIEFAFNNSHRTWINESLHDQLLQTYTSIEPKLARCQRAGTDEACNDVSKLYRHDIELPILKAAVDLDDEFSVYDVRESGNRPDRARHATSTIDAYLQREDVVKAIGAEANFAPEGGDDEIMATGDGEQCHIHVNFVEGSRIVPVTMLQPQQTIANALRYPGQDEFREKDLESYTVAGVEKGTYKAVGNLGFVRVYDASHSVGFQKPETLFQIFRQTLMRNLTST